MATELPHMKPTHFFKIIHSQTQSLHQWKLMIPTKFVKKYGEELPEAIFLQPPNEESWKVNLAKSDGKMWFEKGWKEFAEFHSLANGHLLVFRYEGTSQVKVQIFNKSALEINYPLRKVEAERESNGQGNNPPNDENLEDCIIGSKRKAIISKPCEMGRSSCAKVGKKLKLQKVALQPTNKNCKGKQNVTTKTVKALEKARSLKTSNPSFYVVMCPSYIIGRSPMNIPSEFGKKHFDLSKKDVDIDLVVSLNGRVWPTKYKFWKGNTFTKFALSKGWNEFVRENNLNVGDVCTFELIIIATKLTFLVHIFKETDKSTCPKS